MKSPVEIILGRGNKERAGKSLMHNPNQKANTDGAYQIEGRSRGNKNGPRVIPAMEQ